MKSLWLEQVIDSVADRGRELLNLRGSGRTSADLEDLCDSLLSEKGEASGTALAREVILAYRGMDASARGDFFEMLHSTFGPDEESIISAADQYKAARDVDSYMNLARVVEAPRQRLFRRINIAPNGIEAIVEMRADLLPLLKAKPHLRAVDADLRHLLASWFNRGFLELSRIDWQTSATILEKLINYESVHEIQSWADLQRRLAADRRCFAFFHPALPSEPLIFVEAALVEGMSSDIRPLLDIGAPVLDPKQAKGVTFYSINNCLKGLRGVSFGNFLIKQVATELAREFPGLKQFSTLSPMPQFSNMLADPEVFTDQRVAEILKDEAKKICAAAENNDLRQALFQLLNDTVDHQDLLARPLTKLGLAYLTCVKRGKGPFDPVAFFHLSNGARLERINPFANVSARGLKESAGLMVNYLYAPEEFESNHEAFVHRHDISMSKKLAKDFKSIKEIWGTSSRGSSANPPDPSV